MSSIRYALEKLDGAVGKLDSSVTNVENALQNYVPAMQPAQQTTLEQGDTQLHDNNGNVIDVDFVAKRLDQAIATVESLLNEDA